MIGDKVEIQRTVAALVAICPRHIDADGKVYVDPDCGDCGSRQEATRIYLLGLVEDAQKALGL